jgi:hypothetical protein
MKVKTSEAEDRVLNYLVGKCEGRKPSCYTGIVRATAHPDFPDSPPIFGPELNYLTDWAQVGRLLSGRSWVFGGLRTMSMMTVLSMGIIGMPSRVVRTITQTNHTE